MLALAGCSAISAGTISQKHYEEPYDSTSMQCSIWVPGTKNMPMHCGFYAPVTQHHAAQYRFDLSANNDDGETQHGWVSVSADDYETHKVGDWFGEKK